MCKKKIKIDRTKISQTKETKKAVLTDQAADKIKSKMEDDAKAKILTETDKKFQQGIDIITKDGTEDGTEVESQVASNNETKVESNDESKQMQRDNTETTELAHIDDDDVLEDKTSTVVEINAPKQRSHEQIANWEFDDAGEDSKQNAPEINTLLRKNSSFMEVNI